MAADESSSFERHLEDLKQKRDELRVQMHLARAEARDEWEKAEQKWNDLQERYGEVKRETGEMVGKARTAVKILMEELGDAYERISKIE